ncbi:hypothetical protein [Spartinivicinus ruber]|uniref:hypothetical protein n=1 Tax=Spartinivicinus ruber TaxID=2683272 RepID=UPI0013D38529|nr:hypothetical protein [Spartinivicinus ruber]
MCDDFDFSSSEQNPYVKQQKKLTVSERDFNMMLDLLEKAKTEEPNENLKAAFSDPDFQRFIVKSEKPKG